MDPGELEPHQQRAGHLFRTILRDVPCINRYGEEQDPVSEPLAADHGRRDVCGLHLVPQELLQLLYRVLRPRRGPGYLSELSWYVWRPCIYQCQVTDCSDTQCVGRSSGDYDVQLLPQVVRHFLGCQVRSLGRNAMRDLP